MEPLQELWDLYEATFPKPELRDTEDQPANVRAPIDPDINFRNKQSDQIATLRQKGKGKNSLGNAYELVKGPLDTGDPIAMADFAGHLAANQKDRSRAPRPEDGSDSLLHQDMMKMKTDTLPDDGDLRRPRNSELSDDQERMNIDDDERDRLQTSTRGAKGTANVVASMGESLTEEVDVDYNEDVSYLQKYGRA
jgi:hypothetical protein